MADELTLGFSWQYSKNGRVRTLSAVSEAFDVSGNHVTDGTQSIGTAAHEALALGDVSTYGFAYFENLDATNFVQIGYDDGGTFRPFLKLLAGQWCFVWLAAAPYAKADTGACILDYVVADR